MLSTRLAPVLLIASLAGPAIAQDIQYQVTNDSGLTLMEFYTSPADEGAWGDDILGASVLASGETGTVDIADGSAQCDRDLRFIFEDGSERVERADVCSPESYRLTSN